MSHWPLSPQDISRPAYRSLAQGIAAAIGSGRLRPGDRLPPHRNMAWRLGVSVQTVSRAYEELIRADLVSGEVGRGSFVKHAASAAGAMPWHSGGGSGRAPIDLSLMTPVRLPEIADAWTASLERVARDLPEEAMHSFEPDAMSARHGEAAATWLARCGLDLPPARILMTNGVTPAMSAALLSVAGPGEVIATDPVTSHSLMPAARNLHLRLQGIPGDGAGMLPEALEAAAAASAGQMKAVFLLPSGAGPEARIMPAARREALAMAARRAGLWIIESDPAGPLVPDLPLPVARFAPERGFYLTGLTKCLSPGLRLGFLAMPEAMADCTAGRHLSMAWMATPLMAEIAADWIASGTAEALMALQRAELARRNRLAVRMLGAGASGHAHGMHRWLPLADGASEDALLDRALQRDVALTPGAAFAVSPRPPAVRICLGSSTAGDLEDALSRVAPLLRAASGVAGSPA
ncbi:PLP-dependent aminotransferase family protein [Poseidonocella sp. HB161398]|uniref:MocR-like ectoine utilization transcription factor EhuR n=1 Tax=Poseidonocella sp. HB161398 TaxID=2320855 RepID=UPI001108E646|nr:PLP-dependent aminotransferase family protein [Poseidonocella sp. HB161398]